MANWSDNAAVLHRFGKHFPGQAFPEDVNAWRQSNTGDAVQLEAKDPELFRLMTGNASATEKADALCGRFSPVPPDPEVIAQQRHQKEVQALFDADPLGKDNYNLTQAMQLATKSPEIYERMREQHMQRHHPNDVAARQQQAQQIEAQQRMDSLQHSRSVRYFNPGPMKKGR